MGGHHHVSRTDKKKQALSDADCIEILKTEPRGVLAILGDNEYPYAVPMNHYYDEKEHKLYFHSGKEGHKVDAKKKHDKVSFCIYDKGRREDGQWALCIRSVIVFGKIKTVENWSVDRMRAFCKKFTQDTDYIENEIKLHAEKTAVWALEIEHMTGKTVNEA